MSWEVRKKAYSRENIQKIAEKIYQNRVTLDRSGNAYDDWITAEKISQSPSRRILFEANCPLVNLRKPIWQTIKFITQDTPRWLLLSFPKLEWVKLLVVPLTIAVTGSLITTQIQKEANQDAILKEYLEQLNTLIFDQKLLNSSPGDEVRIVAHGRTVLALYELDLKRRKRLFTFLASSGLLSPRGTLISKGFVIRFYDPRGAQQKITPSSENLEIPLPIISFAYQDLSNLNLEGIDLIYLDFEGANLSNTNISNTFVGNTTFLHASLEGADLQKTTLASSDLRNADLRKANLQKSSLLFSDLSNANLSQANLKWANIGGSIFEKAVLIEADLSTADLNFDQISLSKALFCRTKLPVSITLDPNRDCNKLGINPETGESNAL